MHYSRLYPAPHRKYYKIKTRKKSRFSPFFCTLGEYLVTWVASSGQLENNEPCARGKSPTNESQKFLFLHVLLNLREIITNRLVRFSQRKWFQTRSNAAYFWTYFHGKSLSNSLVTLPRGFNKKYKNVNFHSGWFIQSPAYYFRLPGVEDPVGCSISFTFSVFRSFCQLNWGPSEGRNNEVLNRRPILPINPATKPIFYKNGWPLPANILES